MRVLIRSIFVVILTALLGGCLGTIPTNRYEVETKVNKFDKYTNIRESGNFVHNEALGGMTQLNMSLMTSTRTGLPTSSGSLTATYRGEDWIFIPDGPSLKFLADGEVVTLTSNIAPLRDVSSVSTYTFISEIIIYDLDRETALKLANAKTLEAQLYIIDFPIPKLTQNRWKSFIKTHWPK